MNRIIICLTVALFLFSCKQNNSFGVKSNSDTIFVHDTIMLEGTFTYNLPCKIEYIHPEVSGKAILVFWLHGGVHDQRSHDLLSNYNHIDQYRNKGYNGVKANLMMSGTKAIFIAPICHKAVQANCVTWLDCALDIKHIIDDYTSKGIADENRVYLLGSSDGGSGTWDLVEKYGEWFAAAMPMSCSRVRFTKVPVYFHSTSSEGDMSAEVERLNQQGANITYEYHPNVKHGGDEIACDSEHLAKLFSHIKDQH